MLAYTSIADKYTYNKFMGNSAKPQALSEHCSRLLHESIPEDDAEYWSKLFALPTSELDILSALDSESASTLIEDQEPNFRTLVAHCIQAFHQASRTPITVESARDASNAVRLVTVLIAHSVSHESRRVGVGIQRASIESRRLCARRQGKSAGASHRHGLLLPAARTDS